MSEDYLGTNIQGVEELQDRIKFNIAKYMNKKDISIDNGTVTFTAPIVQQQKSAMPMQRYQLVKNYNELLNKKIQSDNLKQKTIDYAEIMIQPSTFCKITLSTNNNQSAILKVICCLPEHAQKMASWWIFKEIDSNNLPILVQQFQNFMKADRIATVHLEKNISGSAKVMMVSPVFNFV